MYKHILVPLDGSARAERALPIAAHIAQAAGAVVELVRILQVREQDAQFAASWEEAESYLRRIAQASYFAKIRVETATVSNSEEPAAAIVSLAGRRGVDLILLGSHGYTGMTRLVAGSIAEDVAHHAPCPVVVIRENGPIPAGMLPSSPDPVRVLVPLDGSEHAESVLLPAARLAVTLGGDAERGFLHLTRVVVLPMRAHNPTEVASREREEILAEAKSYLQETAENFKVALKAGEQLAISIATSVVVDDDIAAGIARLAESGDDLDEGETCKNCQIIAMATHHLQGQQAWATGSVTERVLQVTRLPMLIAPVRAS